MYCEINAQENSLYQMPKNQYSVLLQKLIGLLGETRFPAQKMQCSETNYIFSQHIRFASFNITENLLLRDVWRLSSHSTNARCLAVKPSLLLPLKFLQRKIKTINVTFSPGFLVCILVQINCSGIFETQVLPLQPEVGRVHLFNMVIVRYNYST